MAMVSCRLPSLVALNGPRLSRSGSDSGSQASALVRGQLREQGTLKTEIPAKWGRAAKELRFQARCRAENVGDSGASQSCLEESTIKEDASTSYGNEFLLLNAAPMLIAPAIAEGAGYSQASYYTSLGLFIISVPGVWSLIKRSTKSKIVRKTFVVPGPNASAENGKSASRLAGEITSSLTRNNFSVTDRGEVVTFEGIMVPSRGQAAFLSFCTAISLGCVALVLTITSPEIGSSWYFLTLLSPLAGLYYWTRASRKEEIKVKMVVADDEASTDVTLQGDDEQIDRLRRELGLMEKGMVYVKGLFEQ